MTFDPTYQGKVMQLAQGEVYDLRPDGRFAYAGAVYDYTSRVALTGYTATSTSGNKGYQTTGGGYIFLSDGWQEVGQVPVAQYSQTQAQALVNQIIRNNESILRNNLLCARYANRFTPGQQAQIRELQNRLQARNNALQAGGLCDQIQTGYPAEYAELSAYLDALMSGETIGVATWVVVVIAATVLAATATAAYFTYKSLADESEKDVKFSKELTATLVNKLTEEEYQQLLQETKGLLTKSKIKGLIRGGSSVAKVALLIVGGWSIYQIIKQARS